MFPRVTNKTVIPWGKKKCHQKHSKAYCALVTARILPVPANSSTTEAERRYSPHPTAVREQNWSQLRSIAASINVCTLLTNNW